MIGTASLHAPFLRKQGPITTGLRVYERLLPLCHNQTARRMGPRVRGDDGLKRSRPQQHAPSSRRTPGPITTGVRGCERHLTSLPTETTRRMGPRVRGDDGLRCYRLRQTQLSSSGLTERSSTPRQGGGMMSATTPHASSRRTPGPITAGARDCERHLTSRPTEMTRRTGPGVRGDDGLKGRSAFAGMTSCERDDGLWDRTPIPC
jgi:hypothetical protein